MTDRVSTSASPEPSGARSARSDSVHAAFRSAALTTALRVERHSARLEELLGFARAMCRRAHGKPLHLALSVGGLNSRRTRQLEAQLGSTLTVHHLVTNEAWLLCVDRWLLERTRAPSPPAIAHLRNSLAQHAHEHAPEQGATFAWICPPAPECPTRPAEAPIHAMPPG